MSAIDAIIMVSMSLSDIAISDIKSVDYHCIISGISKSEAINIMQNIDLTKKSGKLESIKNLLSHIKLGNVWQYGN